MDANFIYCCQSCVCPWPTLRGWLAIFSAEHIRRPMLFVLLSTATIWLLAFFWQMLFRLHPFRFLNLLLIAVLLIIGLLKIHWTSAYRRFFAKLLKAAISQKKSCPYIVRAFKDSHSSEFIPVAWKRNLHTALKPDGWKSITSSAVSETRFRDIYFKARASALMTFGTNVSFVNQNLSRKIFLNPQIFFPDNWSFRSKYLFDRMCQNWQMCQLFASFNMCASIFSFRTLKFIVESYCDRISSGGGSFPFVYVYAVDAIVPDASLPSLELQLEVQFCKGYNILCNLARG